MQDLVFDIETAINERAHEFFAKKEYKPDPALSSVDDPPSKITELKTEALKAERLAEWRITQALKLAQSVLQQQQRDIDKAPLHWWTAKVICISVETEDEETTWAGPDEKTLLQNFFRYLITSCPSGTLLGKSSLFFDIPLLIGRALYHDIGLPPHLRIAHEPIRDINRIFHYSDNCPQITSLETYAFGLGIDGKLGAGSNVAEWYALALTGDADAWAKISSYCRQDVSIVAEMRRRYRKEFKA